MRKIFKDRRHNQAFTRDGYLKLDALDIGVINVMEEFFLVNSDQDFTGWQSSLELSSPKRKAKIFEFLANIFDRRVSHYLNDYRAIAGGFVSKKSDADSVVHLHPDWAFVDERAYTSLNLWIPLCRTDARNGTLSVLRSSHKIKQSVRGIGIPLKMNFSHDQAAKYLTLITMEPGWILFYDPRLIHGSGVNRSGRPRTVANISLIPAEAAAVHYLGANDGVVEIQVDAGFYHRLQIGAAVDPGRFHYSVNTDGYKSRKIEYLDTGICEEDLIRLYEPRLSAALKRFRRKLKFR